MKKERWELMRLRTDHGSISRLIRLSALFLTVCMLLACMSACGRIPDSGDDVPRDETVPDPGREEDDSGKEDEEQSSEMKELYISIDGKEIAVDWEDNGSVEALRELVSESPLTVAMSRYGGFEQVGPLGTSLPRNDKSTRTSAGDIVLYSGNQIVVFYGSNSWAYTRLGKIRDMSEDELSSLLGNSDVELVIYVK